MGLFTEKDEPRQCGEHSVQDNKCTLCGMSLHDIVNTGSETCAGAKLAVDRQKLHGRIENDFSHHVPKEGQGAKIEANRDKAKTLAHFFVENCPPSRELWLALTKLEEALFYANAALVRGG